MDSTHILHCCRREFFHHSKCNYTLLTSAIKSKGEQTETGEKEAGPGCLLIQGSMVPLRGCLCSQNENFWFPSGSRDRNGTHGQVQDTIFPVSLVGYQSSAARFCCVHFYTPMFISIAFYLLCIDESNLYHKIHLSNINYKKKK